MTNIFLRLAIPLVWLSLHVSPGLAQDVTVTELPPYATQAADGTWQGPAVDLLRQAADAAGAEYRLVAASNNAADGTDGRFPVYAQPDSGGDDAAANSLPFHVDSVALIGGNATRGQFLTDLLGLFNIGFAITVGLVCLLLLLFGLLFWLAERSNNEDVAADGSTARGIGNGFWWAGVTATTIGYGDLVPKTLPGRAVAMIWMLFSMALTALLTAYIVSLVGGRDGSAAPLSEAVAGKRIGFIPGYGVTEEQLAEAERATRFADPGQALRALDGNEVDAIALPHAPAKALAGDRTVQQTSTAFVLPLFRLDGSLALLREVNRIILSPAWQQRMEAEYGGD